MKCKPVSFFGAKYKLSEKVVQNISKSTKLTKDELFNMPLSEQVKLMEERGAIKKKKSIKNMAQNLYKKFGEKTGLLKK